MIGAHAHDAQPEDHMRDSPRVVSDVEQVGGQQLAASNVLYGARSMVWFIRMPRPPGPRTSRFLACWRMPVSSLTPRA